MKKVLKLLGLSVVSLVVLLFVLLSGRAILDQRIDYDVDLAGTEVPTFDTIELQQEHSYSDATSLPVTGGAAIDIDGDGVDEIFIGGGHGQADMLYQFNGSGFDVVPNAAGIDKPEGGASLGALVLDVDKDGKQDLIIARPTGIWLYSNNNGTFSGRKLDAPMLADTTPVSVAVADINGDGHFDMYVSGYIRNDLIEGLNIFNKEGYGGTSVLFIVSVTLTPLCFPDPVPVTLYVHNEPGVVTNAKYDSRADGTTALLATTHPGLRSFRKKYDQVCGVAGHCRSGHVWRQEGAG